MLAILTTHPIQYQVPLWQALARDASVPFEVWYLSEHGVRPAYDVQFGKSFAWDFDTLDGYAHRFLKVNRDADVSVFNRLQLKEPLGRLLSERRVSALWMQGWQVRAYWQAAWQADRAGVPVWLRGESNDLAPVSRLKGMAKRVLLGELFRRVSHFLYIGQANRRLYESYGARSEQLHPAPYCVDNERFRRQAAAQRSHRTDIRRRWNIPEDALCLLFAGKFIAKKRPFDLVEAARDPRLQVLGRPVHLLFVGSGELGAGLRRATRAVFDAERETASRSDEEEGRTHLPAASFAGFLNQTEISQAYVAADCLVLPSDDRETWGLVVNEAMASGLPCLVSEACGCGEDLVAPLAPQWRFRTGDPSALATAVLAFVERPARPGELRAQVDKFDLSVSAETVSRLYSAHSGGTRREFERAGRVSQP